MKMVQELELEVFRAGDYGPKGDWTDADLDHIAESYRRDLHEAPVTLDHAQTGPALGWVAGIKRSGDRLIARLHGVSEGLMAQLRAGAFKKRSVEIYRQLPETGGPYLKAVSFLGAAAPAVKGLSDVLFTAPAEPVAFSLENGTFELFELETAEEAEEPALGDSASEDDFDPDWMGEDVSPEPDPDEAFATIESELRRAGRWAPPWESQGIREFFRALGSVDEIELSGGQAINPAAWFAEFLNQLPAYLPMGEAAPAARVDQFDAIPTGPAVSSDSIGRHRRAVSLRERRPELSYAEALTAANR